MDEILYLTLSKCDAESICVSSLSSEEVTGLVADTKHLRLKLPCCAALGPDSVPTWPRGMLQFVENYSTIKVVTMEFKDDENPSQGEDSLCKWTCHSFGFVLLFAKELIKSKFFKELGLDPEQRPARNDPVVQQLVIDAVYHSRLYLRYAKDIININPDLETINVEDSSGRLVIDRMAITQKKFPIPEYHTEDVGENFTRDLGEKIRCSIVWTPELATVPGCMLRQVCLVSSQPTGDVCEQCASNSFSTPFTQLFEEEVWNNLTELIMKERPSDSFATRFESFSLASD